MNHRLYELCLATGSKLMLLSFVLCLAFSAVAQEGQLGDGTRQIFAEEFTRSRPEKPKTTPPKSTSKTTPSTTGKTSGNAPPRRRYTRVPPAVDKNTKTSTAPSTTVKPTAEPLSQTAGRVGVTVWRLRPGQDADKGARLLVQEGDGELVPERVGTQTQLRVRDRVRLSIESPREGYLYVVDREIYADGSLGEPYMIFPTTRTRGGDNRVTAGKLIDIPAQEDRPNYFTLIPRPDRDDQVGELLSIIVTTQPLENFEMTRGPIKLAAEQVEKWEQQWATRVEQYEMVGGAGQTWSKEEKEASAESSGRLLTQEDPSPQVVYLIEGKNNQGLLINVPLSYKR